MTMQQIQKTAQSMRNTCTTKSNADAGECKIFRILFYNVQYYN